MLDMIENIILMAMVIGAIILAPIILIWCISLAIVAIPVLLALAAVALVWWVIKHRLFSRPIVTIPKYAKPVSKGKVPASVFGISVIVSILVTIVLVLLWMFWFPAWLVWATIGACVVGAFIPKKEVA